MFHKSLYERALVEGEKGYALKGLQHRLVNGSQSRVWAKEFDGHELMIAPAEDKIFMDDRWCYGVPQGAAEFSLGEWRVLSGWEKKVIAELAI